MLNRLHIMMFFCIYLYIYGCRVLYILVERINTNIGWGAMMTKKPDYEDLEDRILELETLLSEKKNVNVYREIVEFLPDPALAIDLEGKITVWNKAMEDLTNIKAKDMLGKDDYEYALQFFGVRRPILIDIVLKNHAGLKGKYKNIRRTGDVLYAEIVTNLINGKRMLLAGKARPIYDSSNTVIGAIEIIRDITEQRKSEESISKRQEQYRLLADNVQDIIWVIDMDMKYTYVSPSVERIRGYTVKEAMNLSIDKVFTPDSLKIFIDIINKEPALRKKKRKARVFEAEQLCKDGTTIWTEVQASFILNEDDKPVAMLGITRDISARKRAEDALRKSEERYRFIAENIHDVISVLDMEMTLTYVSPSVERLRGYMAEEVLAQPLEMIFTSDSMELIKKVLSEELKLEKMGSADKQRPRTVELEQIRKDGSTVWTEVTGSFIHDHEGSPIGIIGVARDINERKRAEQEKKNYEMRLIRAQKMEAIGTLAGGIAHDFNNILSAIIGYTELARGCVPADSRAYTDLKEALKAEGRAKDLVSQILTFSRQVETTPKPIMVHLVVKEALKLLRSSIPTTISIEQHIEDTTGAVLADPTHIHQVVMNLCTNAYHAMREKGGVLKVCLTSIEIDDTYALEHPNLHAGPYINLTVSDTGKGMDAETICRIFDPFFTTKIKGEGTGLGLSIVHGIVIDMDGDIIVSSEPGKGSVFEVFFPVFGLSPKGIPENDESIPRGNGENILIVDDEQTILQFTKKMLKNLGYKVHTTVESKEALEMFLADKGLYDLVITDLTMPKMTGYQLASEVKMARPDIPIILISGFSEKVLEKDISIYGISKFVNKPYTQSAIGKAVHAVLNSDLGIE